MEEVEVVIAGGGVAGCAAAAEAARLGARVVLVSGESAFGALATIDEIEGVPGLAGVSGYELCPTLLQEAEQEGVEVRVGAVRALRAEAAGLVVEGDPGGLRASAVIAATGCAPIEPAWPSAAGLLGRGISYCASCDGPIFRGAPVAVVGGGDSGLQEALALLAQGTRPSVFEQRQVLPAADHLQRRVRAAHRIGIRVGARVVDVLGQGHVRAVVVEDVETRTCNETEVAGVFVYAGRTPETAWLGALDVLDEQGRIRVDARLGTEVPGLFAAGDVRAGSPMRAASALGDGITAAHAALEYLGGAGRR